MTAPINSSSVTAAVTSAAASAGSGVGPANAGDQIASFIERVVPWPAPGEAGFINLHWLGRNPGSMPGRAFTDPKVFMSVAQWGAVHPEAMKDIYFCLTRQSTMKAGKSGKPRAVRSKPNATHAKALWIDADVKADQPEKCYTSTAALVTALQKFLTDAALPGPSAIVASGSGGLHIYWISNRVLTTDEWRLYAEGLKTLAVKHGFKCDAGLTTDAARVLRVPGTFNRKHDPAKPVVLLDLGQDYDFGRDLAHVATMHSVEATAAAPAARPPFDLSAFSGKMAPAFAAKLDARNDNLAEGINTYDDTPLNPDAIFKFCPHFDDAAIAHGKGYSQGLWMLDVLAATFMDDGRRWAHYFSKGYATYSKDETDKMYDRKISDREQHGLGWPSCQAFENEGCKQCATCAYRGKVSSPLNLAVRELPGGPQPPPPSDTSFVDPYADFFGPAFPLATLPPTLREFVTAEHRAMGADPSAVAMAVLTVVAGAINAETCVRVGEDSWFEKPILWTLLIGNPSTQKSPIIEKAVKQLRMIDAVRQKDWLSKYQQWKRLLKAQQSQMPPPPKPARCVMTDITAEKVAEFLSRAPSGSLLVHDELAGWIDGFERYSSGGAARAFYLQCWNGGPHNKDRVGKGGNDEGAEIFIENLALNILGGIQPDRLAKVKDLTSDGLLQRGLPVLMRPAERGDENYSVASAEDKYADLIRRINDVEPQKYFFDDDARAVLNRLLDYLHGLEQINGFSSALIGAIGKLKGYFARLCLVLHIAYKHDSAAQMTPPAGFTPEGREKLKRAFRGMWNCGGSLADGIEIRTAITTRTAEAVEQIIREFLLPHIFRVYDVLDGGKDREKLRATANFILRSGKVRLRPSDFMEGVRPLRGLSTKDINDWVGRFYAMGWLRPEDTTNPSKAWLVESGLRERFAERCQQAKLAAAEAHKILLAGGSRSRETASDNAA